MKYFAKCNLRINRETILKGTELDSIPEGFERYFEPSGTKEIETASVAPKSERRVRK
jgi:hypothetical protein